MRQLDSAKPGFGKKKYKENICRSLSSETTSVGSFWPACKGSKRGERSFDISPKWLEIPTMRTINIVNNTTPPLLPTTSQLPTALIKIKNATRASRTVQLCVAILLAKHNEVQKCQTCSLAFLCCIPISLTKIFLEIGNKGSGGREQSTNTFDTLFK